MRQFRRPGRKYVLIALAASVAAAAALGLTPVLAGGKKVQTGFIGGLEASAASSFHNAAHFSLKDAAFDKRQLARCATPGYRATYPSKCPAMTPSRAKAERAQRTACARPRYKKAHPALCPDPKVLRVNRALKRAFAAGEPPSSIGGWTGRIIAPGLPINAVLLATGKVLWWAYPQKPNFADGYNQDDPNPGAALNYSEAYVFDPATGASVRRDPPTNPPPACPSTSGAPARPSCATAACSWPAATCATTATRTRSTSARRGSSPSTPSTRPGPGSPTCSTGAGTRPSPSSVTAAWSSSPAWTSSRRAWATTTTPTSRSSRRRPT